jgi:LmbE family N-acetylglucosaminyl deacetylase
MSSVLGKRVVVLSPHLDDAVLSLGAAIAATTRSGGEVKVVTALANDPASAAPAAPWDSACGFTSEGDAARARRQEDRRACALVGAKPIWLPFKDEEYGRGAADGEIFSALAAEASGADAVVIPGFPLAHRDHAWLTELILRSPLACDRIGLYVEQPYATWRSISRGRRRWAMEGLALRRGLRNSVQVALRRPSGRALQQPTTSKAVSALVGEPLEWLHLPQSPASWWAKQRAMRAYRSQLRGFGPLVPERIALYESGWGGEGLAWAAP